MKKTTPKSKVIIVKRPKAPKFDLSFSKTVENTKIIVALESLKHNEGWQFLTQIFQKNIKYIEQCIITKQDGEKDLLERDIDLLRMKHSYLTEILKKPAYYLKELTRTETVEDDLDPYEK